MPTNIPYRREDAVSYARKWAFSRNPRYFNFDGIGGDCTNFISQCIYAGCGVMNYTKDTGWYYSSPSNRAAGWSGVPYLYNFLTRNQKAGPYAVLSDASAMEPGDVIQLGDATNKWYHSLLVVDRSDSDLYVSTHSYDAYMRPLSDYIYAQARFLHITGARR